MRIQTQPHTLEEADSHALHSYFTIIHWVWTSQTGYDIQFQADDIYHRVMKAVQVSVFVYIGAGSGKWNPGYIQDPAYVPGISDSDAVRNSTSMNADLESWS